MKYELPDSETVKNKKPHEFLPIIVYPDEGKSVIDLALTIARASILSCSSVPGGLAAVSYGFNAGREELISADDLNMLRTDAEQGNIYIDYWGGRCVKFSMDVHVERPHWFQRLVKRLRSDRVPYPGCVKIHRWGDYMIIADHFPASEMAYLRRLLQLAEKLD